MVLRTLSCSSYPSGPTDKGMELPVLGITVLEAKMPLPSSRHYRITEQSRLKGTLEVPSVTRLPKQGQIQR